MRVTLTLLASVLFSSLAASAPAGADGSKGLIDNLDSDILSPRSTLQASGPDHVFQKRAESTGCSAVERLHLYRALVLDWQLNSIMKAPSMDYPEYRRKEADLEKQFDVLEKAFLSGKKPGDYTTNNEIEMFRNRLEILKKQAEFLEHTDYPWLPRSTVFVQRTLVWRMLLDSYYQMDGSLKGDTSKLAAEIAKITQENQQVDEQVKALAKDKYTAEYNHNSDALKKTLKDLRAKMSLEEGLEDC